MWIKTRNGRFNTEQFICFKVEKREKDLDVYDLWGYTNYNKFAIECFTTEQNAYEYLDKYLFLEKETDDVV